MSESQTYHICLAYKQLQILNFWMIIYLIQFQSMLRAQYVCHVKNGSLRR